jgi:hypothetical protein
MKTFKEFIYELTQSELDVEAKKVNQNTRNAPIQRQQPPSQPDDTTTTNRSSYSWDGNGFQKSNRRCKSRSIGSSK